MRRIEDYKIAQGESCGELAEVMKPLLEAGYVPAGDLVVIQSDLSDSSVWLYQPMLLPKPRGREYVMDGVELESVSRFEQSHHPNCELRQVNQTPEDMGWAYEFSITPDGWAVAVSCRDCQEKHDATNQVAWPVLQ